LQADGFQRAELVLVGAAEVEQAAGLRLAGLVEVQRGIVGRDRGEAAAGQVDRARALEGDLAALDHHAEASVADADRDTAGAHAGVHVGAGNQDLAAIDGNADVAFRVDAADVHRGMAGGDQEFAAAAVVVELEGADGDRVRARQVEYGGVGHARRALAVAEAEVEQHAVAGHGQAVHPMRLEAADRGLAHHPVIAVAGVVGRQVDQAQVDVVQGDAGRLVQAQEAFGVAGRDRPGFHGGQVACHRIDQARRAAVGQREAAAHGQFVVQVQRTVEADRGNIV